MLQERQSDAEVVASFLNVFAGPLGRAIVDEMVKRGVPTPGVSVTALSSDLQGHLCPNCARLQRDIESLEKDRREDRERAEMDWKQMNRLLSRIEELQAELTRVTGKPLPAVESLDRIAERVKAGRYRVGVDPGAPGGDRTVTIRARPEAVKEAAERRAGQKGWTDHGAPFMSPEQAAEAVEEGTGRDGPDLDDLIDFEDSLPGQEPAGGNGEKAKPATCESCKWWSGKVCQRQGSLWVNKHVGAGKPACEKHEEKPPQRGKVLPKAHPRFQDIEPAAVTEHIGHRGVRPRAVCDRCGTEHSLSSRGLYPHDVNGVEYRAGRGNRAKPCKGKPKAMKVGA